MQILIADDDPAIRKSLEVLLRKEHDLITCEDGLQALQALEKTTIDLVITDFQMPNLSGLELIQKGKEISSYTVFVLMTAFGSVNQAVEAIRLGADDYLVKPFDLSEIRHRVRQVEELIHLRNAQSVRAELSGDKPLVGKSPAIQEAYTFIQKVAPVTSPVLILGPSGTGKEVVARAIHDSGPRAKSPFIAVNCASLNEQLLESELFGHEKGAFTGAIATKQGKFELAKGGTLFLDEIGELSPSIQARLLRVLQEKEFFRVGGVRQVKSDTRVIAATHRPLKTMVKDGLFREDLFFRLNVLPFELPPLAARTGDIPLLVDFFWNKLTKELGKKLQLSSAALQCLSGYSFPGNVRELQNVLERMVVLGPDQGTVGPELVPSEIRSSQSAPAPIVVPTAELSGKSLLEMTEDFERSIIEKVMEQTGNNQVQAARLLKISRGALQSRLQKYRGNSGETPDANAA